jgi:uncharacterized membrane protein
MLTSPNFWMGFAGLLYLVAGVFVLRKEIGAARGWEKLIALDCVFIAVSLAVFAPEHFRGPEFVAGMVPAYMPVRWFWAYLVGGALLAAATSLTLRQFVRLSSMLLGLMFFLFVSMLFLPSALRHPDSRFPWTYSLRDLSFCAGAWAIAGLESRASSPRLAKGLILFSRIVLAVAAVFYAAQHFLHPGFVLGVPLEKKLPTWVPLPNEWSYLVGAILLAAGICLALNWKPRMSAASIGALMTALVLFLYVPMMVVAYRGSPEEFNEGLNYVADTLLYAGAVLGLASALPRDSDQGEEE